MGNWISKDSYLDKYACSARNITWQYIHSNGSLPTAYADCPGSQAILNSHCCQEGRCHPTYFLDMEFERYEWNDWDGLGSPYMPGEKASSQSWLLCKVIWGEDERHSHIIGVDGKDVKNESAVYPTNEVDIKGNHLTERGLMSGPDRSKHFPLAYPDHQTSLRMTENNSDTIVSSPSPARAQKPIAGGLLSWTDQYQSQINDGTKAGILVAGIITVSVIGLICVLVLLFVPWGKAQKNNSFSRLMQRRRRRNIGPWNPISEERVVIEDGLETYHDLSGVGSFRDC